MENKEVNEVKEEKEVNKIEDASEEQDTVQSKEDKWKKIRKSALEWIYCALIAFVLAVIIKYFIGTPTVVKQTSMIPTLQQEDRLILNRISKTFNGKPSRGDIVTFEQPSKLSYSESEVDLNNPIAKYENEPEGWFNQFCYHVLEINKTSFIKRVIGVEGDKIEIKDGYCYVNGEKENAYYLDESVTTPAKGHFTKFTVPEGYVFCMGDNRNGSLDCRSFGCIPIEKIEGTVVLRFWPLNKFGGV